MGSRGFGVWPVAGGGRGKGVVAEMEAAAAAAAGKTGERESVQGFLCHSIKHDRS